MRVPMFGLAAACGILGLLPVAVWPAVQHAVAAWNPGWPGSHPPASLATLSAVQIALAILAVMGASALWRRARTNGVQRGLTWDCGYAAPTARMQYTGGSFAVLAVGWFAWVLQPQRRRHWPRGLCPGHADHMERIPETVLERVIGPASAVVMSASAWVRQRQHGRLPDYILYLVAGLAAVGLLVVFGSMQ
jgi:hydrogenase-4 component B